MNIIKKNNILISLIILGIVIRLLFIFFFNATHDFFNILALSKSVLDTGNLTDGFFALLRNNFLTQLFGKIYYQIIAVWLYFLKTTYILNTDLLFDTKPFTNSHSYLVGLFQWGPSLHQLIVVKIMQFFYDAILLFSMYSIAKIIKPSHAMHVVLFWAITPFLMIAPYVDFQSDLAIAALLSAGSLFWIKALQNKSLLKFWTYTFLTIFIFILGAVMKQVPLLIIPFILISLSKNLKTFLINCAITSMSYLLISQPWGSDSQLIKLYFFLSNESLAIFKFQINGMSIFFLSYIFFLYIIFLNRAKVFQKNINIVLINIVIIAIVYLTDDSSLLFAQFMIWILPFIALATLYENGYAILFLGPILGNYKRIMSNTDLSHMLSPTFGYGMNSLPNYQQIVTGIINPELVGIVIWSLMAIVLIYTIIISILDILQLPLADKFRFPKTKINIDLKKITLMICIGFWMMFSVDFFIKTRLTSLATQNYSSSDEKITLSKTPLVLKVNNLNKKTINAIEITTSRNKVSYLGKTILEFVDNKNNSIFKQQLNDLYFPETKDSLIIPLKQSINNADFEIKIYKEDLNNTIYVYKAKQISTLIGENTYDKPSTKDKINITFPDQSFEIVLRGTYTSEAIMRSIMVHINKKPKFYLVYFSGTVILIFIILLLRNKKLNEKN